MKLKEGKEVSARRAKTKHLNCQNFLNNLCSFHNCRVSNKLFIPYQMLSFYFNFIQQTPVDASFWDACSSNSYLLDPT